MFRIILLLLTFSFNSVFCQTLNIFPLIGTHESVIRQKVKVFSKVRDEYTESGKSLVYYYPTYMVTYGLKSGGICNRIFVYFKYPKDSELMNQWFYENGFISKLVAQSGDYEWTKNVKILSGKKRNEDEVLVTAVRLDDQNFYFANKLAVLLGR
jgi:hypothetical protein